MIASYAVSRRPFTISTKVAPPLPRSAKPRPASIASKMRRKSAYGARRGPLIRKTMTPSRVAVVSLRASNVAALQMPLISVHFSQG